MPEYLSYKITLFYEDFRHHKIIVQHLNHPLDLELFQYPYFLF